MWAFMTAEVTNGLENTFTDNSLLSQAWDISGPPKFKNREKKEKSKKAYS